MCWVYLVLGLMQQERLASWLQLKYGLVGRGGGLGPYPVLGPAKVYPNKSPESREEGQLSKTKRGGEAHDLLRQLPSGTVGLGNWGGSKKRKSSGRE